MSLFEELNKSGIPKFFWYVVSLAIIALTVLIGLMCFRAQSVDIELASAKIQFNVQRLEGEAAKLETTITTLQEAPATRPAVATTRPAIVDSAEKAKLDTSLKTVREAKDSLKAMQVQR